MLSRKLANPPILSAETERELIIAWRENGDRAAMDLLLAAHMRLCYSIAGRFTSNPEHLRDLAQAGAIGLMKALEKYDLSCGTRFSTYARWWVLAEIRESVPSVTSVVDVPLRKLAEANQVADSISTVPRPGDVISLDTPFGESGQTTLADTIRDGAPLPDEQTAATEFQDIVRKAVSDGIRESVTEREADIIRQRLLKQPPETLDAIGSRMGISRERVRQIETRARQKFQRYLTSHGFDPEILRG